MTLFEFAFINSLVENNYRRRMKIFYINIFFMLIPGLILNLQILDGMYEVLCGSVSFVSLVYFLFKYFISAPDGENNLPWKVYDKQKDVISFARKDEGSFEELKFSPILSEYFC